MRYCPAGVKSKLPSGENVSRLKKLDNVSAAYMGACLTPKPTLPPKPIPIPGRGEFVMTAGRGSEGAGDADLRIDGEDPNDDLRLCDVGGGFIGSKLCGVPGAEGPGDGARSGVCSAWTDVRGAKSGGAGLLDEILLRAGKSIRLILW
jgi:hypothetical protein